MAGKNTKQTPGRAASKLDGMGVDELIVRLRRAGVDLYLWRGEVRWAGGPAKGFDKKIQARIEAEIDENRRLLKDKLLKESMKARAKHDEPHVWLARRAAGRRPPLLSCGSVEWCQHFIRGVNLFSDKDERKLWLVLGTKGVLLYRDEAGAWCASVGNLPEGVEPLGPVGLEPVILSICDECRPEFEPDASGDDAVKSGDDDGSTSAD